MKKKVLLFYILVLLCMITFFVLLSERPQLKLQINDNDLSLFLSVNGCHETLYPWENTGGEYYFFLPSYINNDKILIESTENKQVTINSVQLKSSYFVWNCDETYDISIIDNNDITSSYKIIFMKSSNIPSVFIETDSGTMESLNADKENKESGAISIYEANGNREYNGPLEWISGRGNSTWNRSKKPYTINLHNEESLLGMDKGSKWCLLALWYESGKLNTKIAMDIASMLNLPFTPKCTWVDLYLNGEYNGIYLLCESISVEEGRVEIQDLEKENKQNNPDIDNSPAFEEDGLFKGYELEHGTNTDGGYLLEKNTSTYYEYETSGFITKAGYYFTLESPSHASREQLEYISSYFQIIEDMIINRTPDYDNYIDLPSFAARYLVDEITFNTDSNVTSMYFYKDENDSSLYAGPVWDYDLTMGWGKNGNKWTLDPKNSILDLNLGDDQLNWFPILYTDEIFYDQVIEHYKKLLPYFELLIDSTIDEYADIVSSSVRMDTVRWQAASDHIGGHYRDFDNNIRYLKYFLAKRLNYLCDKWQIDHDGFTTEGNGQQHKVTFVCNGITIAEEFISDGDILNVFPYINGGEYDKWYYALDNESYSDLLPIFEDCTLYMTR